MDAREFIGFRENRKVTADSFKGHGRKALLKEIATDKAAYLISGELKKSKPVVLLTITADSFSLLCDDGRGNCQRIPLDGLSGFADVLVSYVVANADHYGLHHKDKRGGRRSNAGRPSALSAENVQEVLELRGAGHSLAEIAKAMNTSRATISRILKKHCR